MRIIHTPARFYPYIGGTEQVVYHLCKGLVKKGHQIRVICANEPAIGDGVIEGIEIKRIPYCCKVANSNITPALFKELVREDFDIIHTHLPHPWSADISAIVSLFKDKPLFLTYYNDIIGEGINSPIANLYNLTALKFLLRRARKIFIAHKGYLKVSSFLRPFTGKIIISPFGVDPGKFKPDFAAKGDNTVTIFFLSKLDGFHRYKGLDYLLPAVKRSVKNNAVELYIGGEGELADYYKLWVKRNGLEEMVHFLGFIRDEDLAKYYNLCDIFVLPSVSSGQEGFGLVALEAMACGKPVIVSNVVGIADDVSKEKAGLVVEPGNIGDLAEAIQYLCFSKGERKIMGENACNLVNKEYAWSRHADIVEGEYKKVYGT
ncbi:MAG: glycosyltransferase [Candidatus Omnitrophica bacterium]|nr:glycosyltransferase [Candidatus Omnitrophota bacterium]